MGFRIFKQLTLDDRIQIEIQYRCGKSLTEIAKHLGKGQNKSTISRKSVFVLVLI